MHLKPGLFCNQCGTTSLALLLRRCGETGFLLC